MVTDIPNWTKAIEVAKQLVLQNGQTEPRTFQEASEIMGKAFSLLLISKNAKYGKGNILNATKFGMSPVQAIMLRENDKTERILNWLNGADLGEEGILESFGDRVGYNMLAMMLQLTSGDKTWYELDLADDSKSDWDGDPNLRCDVE